MLYFMRYNLQIAVYNPEIRELHVKDIKPIDKGVVYYPANRESEVKPASEEGWRTTSNLTLDDLEVNQYRKISKAKFIALAGK